MNLFHVSKIKVSLGELLPDGDVQGDLCVVVVVAQVHVFIHVIFNNKGLVAVQVVTSTVWVKQRGEGAQVPFTEGCDEAVVEAQLVQENLE